MHPFFFGGGGGEDGFHLKSTKKRFRIFFLKKKKNQKRQKFKKQQTILTKKKPMRLNIDCNLILCQIVSYGVTLFIGKSLWLHSRFSFRQIAFAIAVPFVLTHGALMIFSRQHQRCIRSLVCLGPMQGKNKIQTWMIVRHHFHGAFSSRYAISQLFGLSNIQSILMISLTELFCLRHFILDSDQSFVLKYREEVMLVTYDLYGWFSTHDKFDRSIYSILDTPNRLFDDCSDMFYFDSFYSRRDDNVKLLRDIFAWCHGEECKIIYERLRMYLCIDVAKIVLDFADMSYRNLHQKRQYIWTQCAILMHDNHQMLQESNRRF